jgi:catechol 2,3-dioxygenase-like lactoylglutathione lyase family enzyme
MNLLRAATLVTPDVAGACDRYVEWLDYRLVETGRMSEDLATSWGTPASSGRPYGVVQPESGAEIYLRFVEGDHAPGYEPLRSYGWAAIEICNQDVLKVNERMLKSPFEIVGPPKAIEGLDTIFPMQVKGPDKEIVYLTEIRNLAPDSGLPKPQSLIDHLFIMVLACSDMEASGRWFCSHLGLTYGDEMNIVYSMINDSFGLPSDTRHRLAMGGFDGDVFIEFDQYPAASGPRPKLAGQLPPGIALCTLRHPNLDAVTAPFIVPPTAREGVIYKGRRAGCIEGPDGALMEIVEG